MKKTYALGLYEKAMPDFELAKKLATARDSGFDYMEISIDETDKKLSRLTSTREELSAIRRAIAEEGTPIRTMCLSGHRRYPFGSHDPAVRARSMEIMARAIDFSSEIGVRIIQLAGYDVYYEEGDADTRRYFAENLERAVELAAASGVLLGFETMETPFLDTVEKGMRHVSRIHSPYLGMYPDIGNLKNAAVIYGTSVAEDLRLGSGHIFAAHLKETKPGLYRDMLFGQPDGHTEYAPCLCELISQGVRTFTGEFWYHDGDDYQTNIRNAARFLRDKIEAAF
jgi:predicted hexulose-6-phosphate isomerase